MGRHGVQPIRTAGVLVLGLVTCLACTRATTPEVAPVHFEQCTAAGIGAECTAVTVPENRATGTGRSIRLRVAVLRARAGHRAPDAVFWIAGGPGGAATDSAGAAAQLLRTANEQRDVVLVDQRGTGGSNDLRCPVGPTTAGLGDDVRTCLATLDGDPSSYTTAWAMDDLDDVRAALGYDRIDLYGISYGVTAAQVYLQRHPAHARAAILESGTLLGVPIYERFPVAAQRALERLFARCAADAGCHRAFPDPAADLRAVTARLERGPVQLPVDDPATGRPRQYTRQDMASGLLEALSDLRTAALLPRMLHSAARGDWADVLAAAAPTSSSGPTSSSSAPTVQLMPLTIDCFEPEERFGAAEAGAKGTFMTYADVRAMVRPDGLCAAIPPPPPEAIHGPAATSATSVLFINGAADPKDPPANVAGAGRVYPHSRALVVPEQAHDYNVDPGCRDSLFAAFLARPDASDLPTQCLQDQPAPPFDLG